MIFIRLKMRLVHPFFNIVPKAESCEKKFCHQIAEDFYFFIAKQHRFPLS